MPDILIRTARDGSRVLLILTDMRPRSKMQEVATIGCCGAVRKRPQAARCNRPCDYSSRIGLAPIVTVAALGCTVPPMSVHCLVNWAGTV